MPIEPVKIPQNVYIEDRIVGPLTLKQTIILMIGGGFSYMLYAAIQKTYGHVSIPVTVIAWSPLAVAALFALVRVNDLSLTRICMLLIERMNKPSVRTWAPRAGISITVRTSVKPADARPAAQAPAQATTQSQIQQLSSVMDRTLPTAADNDETNNQKPFDIAQGKPVTNNSPVAAQTTDSDLTEETKADLPPLPVNKDKIQVDPSPALSDLKVFRDIFTDTHTHTWQ